MLKSSLENQIKFLEELEGFVITSADNIMAPNAGIDKSNAKKGKAILYPKDPYLIAEQIRRKNIFEIIDPCWGNFSRQ